MTGADPRRTGTKIARQRVNPPLRRFVRAITQQPGLAMYRIELRAGEEASYNTFDEFASAVRSGVIGANAKVWHGASSKWLPVTVHPHYKRAHAAPAPTAPAPTPVTTPAVETPRPAASAPHARFAPPAPVATAPSGDLEFLEVPDLLPRAPRAVAGSLFGPQPATPRHIEALVAAADLVPAPELAAQQEDEILIDISRPRLLRLNWNFNWRINWRINWRVAGMAAGILAVAGISAIVLTRTPKPDTVEASDSTSMASTSLAATPSSSFEVSAPAVVPNVGSGASTAADEPTAYMDMPVIPEGPATTATDTTRVLPAAPRLGALKAGPVTATGSSPAALGARYSAAHDAAEAALENRLRGSGIAALFSDARLASGSVSDSRLAVSGIANYIRTFRMQDAAIESAYRDSAAQLDAKWNDADAAAWAALMTRGESSQAARATDQLLSDVSSLLGVLEEQAGAYALAGGKVTFRDAGATLRYSNLRRRVADRLAAGDSASPVAAALRRVIGSGLPPVETFSE